MEDKNIYPSVFPELLELLSSCLLKLTKSGYLQVMRVTIMLRITRVSLSIGWYNKIRFTLSTVASSVNKLIKTTSKSLYFDVLATNQRMKMILFATGENESLFKGITT